MSVGQTGEGRMIDGVNELPGCLHPNRLIDSFIHSFIYSFIHSVIQSFSTSNAHVCCNICICTRVQIHALPSICLRYRPLCVIFVNTRLNNMLMESLMVMDGKPCITGKRLHGVSPFVFLSFIKKPHETEIKAHLITPEY